MDGKKSICIYQMVSLKTVFMREGEEPSHPPNSIQVISNF